MQQLLEDNIAHITPTTIWVLKQDEFWQLTGQQSIRLQVSFTVFDKFNGNTGHLTNIVALLKTPDGLSSVWKDAVFAGCCPITWNKFDLLSQQRNDEIQSTYSQK